MISDLLVENVIELAGYIPVIGPFVGPVWKTGEVAWAIHTILQSTADPRPRDAQTRGSGVAKQKKSATGDGSLAV